MGHMTSSKHRFNNDFLKRMCAVLTGFKDTILLEIRCQTSEKEAFPSNTFPLSTTEKMRLSAVQVTGPSLL